MRRVSSALSGRAHPARRISWSRFHRPRAGGTEDLCENHSQGDECGVVLRLLSAGALPQPAAGVHGHARYGFYEFARADSSQRLQYGLDSDGLSRREGEIMRARAARGAVAKSLGVRSGFALGWFLRL